MKKLAFSLVVLAATALSFTQAFAHEDTEEGLAPSRVESITKLANGTVRINYDMHINSRNGIELRMVDDDGMLTLTTLHFLLIQDKSAALWWSKDQEKDWEKISKEKVADWASARKIEKEAIDRLAAYWTKEGDANEIKMIEALQSATKSIMDSDDATYADLNIIGKYIRENGQRYAYLTEDQARSYPLLDGSTSNPIGVTFATRPMTLPPQIMSRSLFPIKADFKQLLKDYEASKAQ